MRAFGIRIRKSSATFPVVGEYAESASFRFNAIAGHEYRNRMHVPGNGNIDLIDDTDRKVIAVHGTSHWSAIV
jgi:hypothetical protein